MLARRAYGRYKEVCVNRKSIGKEHRLIAAAVLGKELPEGVEIHHVDFNRANNRNDNLVICESRSYHQLLHRRQEIQDAGFDPNTYLKCTDCTEYKLVSSFNKNRARTTGYCNLCKTCDHKRNNDRYHRRKLCSA